MMRALLLEFPGDRTVRHIGEEYMLGEALLVAPAFDQTAMGVYLPQGSWIELTSGARVAGSRWVDAAPALDEIPLYLRENRCLFMLPTAPDHIADDNFSDLTAVMNLTDCLSQDYYDDGVTGRITAKISGDTVEITSQKIPLTQIRLYCPRAVRRVTVNGTPWRLESQGHSYLASQDV